MAKPTLEDEYSHECHDCGETFGPRESTDPCVSQGHYVGPIAVCEVPYLFAAKDS